MIARAAMRRAQRKMLTGVIREARLTGRASTVAASVI
jgi:hypothetical protein